MNARKVIWFALSTVPLLVVSLFAYDTYRLYMNGRTTIPVLGVLLGFINPPADYFISRGGVALQSGEREYKIVYTHKYYGGYSVELSIPGEIDITEKINTCLSFDCTYYDSEGYLTRHAISTNLVLHSNGRGSIFGVIDKYEVPENLSIDETWDLRVKIHGDAKSFLEGHQNATISIEKASDE